MIRREVRIENHVVLNRATWWTGPSVARPDADRSVDRPPRPRPSNSRTVFECWRAASPDRSPPAGAGPGVRARAAQPRLPTRGPYRPHDQDHGVAPATAETRKSKPDLDGTPTASTVVDTRTQHAATAKELRSEPA